MARIFSKNLLTKIEKYCIYYKKEHRSSSAVHIFLAKTLKLANFSEEIN